MKRRVLAIMLAAMTTGLWAQSPDDTALQHSVDELRGAIGLWDVTTELLNEDGTVSDTLKGTYEFSWIVPSRVVAGRSEIPSLDRSAGILFYINESKQTIEMVSVGNDGRLWIMVGPLGGDQRVSNEFTSASGTTARLRFTRFNVKANEFESRMEYSEDGGTSWKPGNHQLFRRRGSR